MRTIPGFDERLWQKAAASTSPRVYFMLMRPPADRARASERRFKRLRSVTCWAVPAALLLAARAHLGVGPSRVEVRVFALSLQLLRFLLLLVVKRHHLLFCVARHKAEESARTRPAFCVFSSTMGSRVGAPAPGFCSLATICSANTPVRRRRRQYHARARADLCLVVASHEIAEQLVPRHLLACPPQLRSVSRHAFLGDAVRVEVVVENGLHLQLRASAAAAAAAAAAEGGGWLRSPRHTQAALEDTLW